ncbi:MAG: tripartite tricarboxylate transporter TctB family protein [Alphaproteobacteria bacterium]|nr:tripartite tricarboxylate transporter TctB family protein [Alphaproteobacteria bacterium]
MWPSGKATSVIELAFWLALALVAFGLSFQFSGEVGTYKWGAASWPRAVVLLMATTALIHAALQFRKAETSTSGADGDGNGERPLASLGLFVIPLIYAWLLPRTGFYLTTPVFLISFLLYVGERRWHVILATTLLIMALVLLVFAKLFYVALPVGNWPGFYDVNNWLLVMIR